MDWQFGRGSWWLIIGPLCLIWWWTFRGWGLSAHRHKPCCRFFAEIGPLEIRLEAADE